MRQFPATFIQSPSTFIASFNSSTSRYLDMAAGGPCGAEGPGKTRAVSEPRNGAGSAKCQHEDCHKYGFKDYVK
jgi:hypothetical protein